MKPTPINLPASSQPSAQPGCEPDAHPEPQRNLSGPAKPSQHGRHIEQSSLQAAARLDDKTRWSKRGLLAAIAAGLLVAVLAGFLYDEIGAPISVKTLGLNYAAAIAWVDANLALAIAAYVAAYVTIAAMFLPGSGLFVAAGGLLFGAWLGTAVAWAGSLIAASVAFALARSLTNQILPRDWPALGRIRDGFNRKALSTMVALRLAPGLPFALGNAAPAVLAVPYRTFLLGSALAFIPSRIAFAAAGAGMASVLDAKNDAYRTCLTLNAGDDAVCPYVLSASSLLTAETVAALVALAILAFVPLLIDRLKVAPRLPGSTNHVEAEPARDRRQDGP